MFWRVVMWPFLSGTNCSTALAKASICSGEMPPHGSLPDHLHVRLALAVDPLLEPEADELVLGVPPERYFSASLSKSSNSRRMIGMTWPGTSSRTSGFASDPCGRSWSKAPSAQSSKSRLAYRCFCRPPGAAV